MNVALKDIIPNPYRNLPEYPIDPGKIERLSSSIKKTGFWDNIVARKRKDGKFEVAYGHHRIHALRKIYPAAHEIGLIVRELADPTMIQVMASENDEVYSLGPAVINETVKAARDYLRAHPEVSRAGPRNGRHTEGPAICAFLSWPQSRVEEALTQIASFETVTTKRPSDKAPPIVVAKKTLESLPSQEQARVFRESVKKYKVPAAHHARLAAEIVKDGVGKRHIPALVAAVNVRNPEAKGAEDLFQEAISAARTLDKKLYELKPLRKALKSGDYDASYRYGQMLVALRAVIHTASSLTGE